MSARESRAREMNFAIRFLTKYQYDADVVDNLNALRVKPATNSRQRVDEFSVRLSPEVRVHRHDDYFGTEVTEFEVSRPHRQLVIDVRARVSTQAPHEPPPSSWETLRRPEYREAGGEFLNQTEDASGHLVYQELIEATRSADTPLGLILLIADLIPGRMEYRKGATYVDSPLSDVLDLRAGVCQDFVHLGLSLLRYHGIAARYVSGYLFATRDQADEESVEVDTHAWVEALLPATEDDAEPVWVGADPTNRGLAGQSHVKIGHGRHYADVPPIKGVYRGLASSELEATVTMTRLEATDPASIARA
jgi:transglutaminase-like putative cysteine protease